MSEPSNTNTNTYNKPNEARDVRDLANLARGMMTLVRCPGGRYTSRGYACMHCGVDYTDTPLCGQPLHEDNYTPFDATVAMRILRESESSYHNG